MELTDSVFPFPQESEVQLPPPPGLKGQSWIPPAPPRENPHGWGQET